MVTPTNYEPSFNNQSYQQAHVVLAMDYVLQQYSLAKGLKKFGKKGENAAYNEIKQQHMRGTLKPVVSKLIPYEKRKAI